jgi:nucleoside-diphosphate kinase
MQKTCAILKPDSVQKGMVGEIISRIETSGFRIVALTMLRLSPVQAERFYQVHQGKPFYAKLVAFMTEGPVVVLVLEKKDAIQAWRDLMGATDPHRAAPGTIRRELATETTRNLVHGSDSAATAAQEIAFFFSESGLLAMNS